MRVSLSAANVTKRYGGVVALADGSLDVRSGEVVALVGANGSGKSTLSKIITGVVSPDGGSIRLDEKEATFASPHVARTQGIIAVYQELSLIPDMTVEENIWLTNEPLRGSIAVNRREVRARTNELLALFKGAVSRGLEADAPIRDLPPDEKQIVEILKAWSIEPRLLILDEATASLDSRQVGCLFDLVEKWKAEGAGIVFVSHRMEEIFRIADRAVVLRNGHTVGNVAMSEASEGDLVRLMVGDVAAAPVIADKGAARESATSGAVRLDAQGLQSGALRDVSLQVRDGELVGLGGLRGQGQEELLLAIFGALPYGGTVRLGGETVRFTHPTEAMAKGVAYVPGERNAQGLLSIRSILENLQLPSWGKYRFPLRMRAARSDAERMTESLHLVMAGLDAPVNSLSGGNAQKVVLGKWLLRSPSLLLLNDPTKGVDVGAKGEIYKLLADLRRQGTAILFYSSDDEELLGLCDRVLVLHDGYVRAELEGERLTRRNLIGASVAANGDTAALELDSSATIDSREATQ
jgi:ribose transport system ATP-binding protein